MFVSVVGLGKLGSCMAAVYASKGHVVVGVDVNMQFVGVINLGKAPVPEKDLQRYITEGKSRLRATADYTDAITNTGITFVIVPTPTNEQGGFSVSFVTSVCESIGNVLKKKDTYHLVVLTSTVLPGDCEEKIIPVLEKYSGKVCGKDFGFCYSPEFIAIGSVIHDLLHPDFLLVGEFDERSGSMLEKFYDTITDNHAPTRRMSISSAELTKISVNSFLTMKITYANMLAEIAEHIPGVDIDAVTRAIGSDKRIAPHYLRSGLGYGGPCFPRDNRAFAYMAKQRGVAVPYAEKTDVYNRSIVDRAVKKITDHISKDVSIGFLGISYKPGTYFSEESQALLIAKALSDLGYSIHIHHPEGHDHAKEVLGDTEIRFHDAFDTCVGQAGALFTANMDRSFDPFFSNLPAHITHIFDPWRQYDATQFSEHVRYIPFGRNV